MPAPKRESEQAAQEPIYPVIESFVEKASAEEVGQFFDSVKEGLSGLKGPRSEQAKKVTAAVSRTEELLSHLLQVREKLEAEKKSAGRSRK